MSLSNQFATNKDREIEGVEIQYGPNEDGSIPTFVISRAGKSNKAYTKALEAKTRPYRKQIQLGTLNEAMSESLFMEVFVSTVLKGWSNVMMRDVTGDANDKGYAPFNEQNAISLFKRLDELYTDLNEKSKDASLFRDEQLEDDLKN